MSHKQINLYTDGGCRGNPGPGAAAWIIADNCGMVLESGSAFSKMTTNNKMEYLAVTRGLEAAKKYSLPVQHLSDSMLIVNQLNGAWKVKDKKIYQLFVKTLIAKKGMEVAHRHVRREDGRISRVDKLVNECMDSNL